MAGQVQFLCLLVVLACVNVGTSFKLEPQIQYELSHEAHTANIDRLFDAFLPVIRQSIMDNGMDPLPLANFSESLLPLPGKLKGSLDFTNGWLQELSKMKRTKHVTASYIDKRLVLDMNLGWRILDFNYRYLFKYLLVRRTGDVYGRFEDIDARVLMSIDLDRYQIYLDSVKFVGVGKFDLRFEGRVTDPLLNIAAKAVTTVFRQHVLNMVESRGLMIFQKVLEDINKKIPVPDRVKDSQLLY